MQPLQFVMRIQISIHAPAKGATESYDEAYKTSMSFQSTLPRRERLCIYTQYSLLRKFQSTLPRRERRTLARRIMRSTHFNPRSREGSDDCVKQYDRHESISIHAPAKGATVTPADGWVKGLISIHAPAKGATLSRSRTCDAGKISIHAPAKGATDRKPLLS